MSAPLPNWVYDVVLDLLNEEDTHKAYQVEVFNIAAGRHELAQHNWCPAMPLALVPDDVKMVARTLARYRRGLEVPSGLSRVTDPTSTEQGTT
jgi:hypothetical protein